jgi:hypothetical protein
MKKIIVVFILFGLFAGCLNKSKAENDKKKYHSDPVTSILGTVVAVPVGAVAGLVRGSVAKSFDYSQSFSESYTPFIGGPLGFLTGLATGSITGLLKGVFTGLVVGVEKPFSAESLSLDGKFRDFEPYEIIPD